MTATAKETDGAFRRDRGRGERPRQHHVEHLPQLGPPGRYLSSGLNDFHAPGEAQLHDGLTQKPAATPARIEKYEPHLWPRLGHDQPGETAAAAQIHAPPVCRGQAREHPERVINVRLDRSGAEKSEATCFAKNVEQTSQALKPP